jgi:kojibiose phosphorylase
MEHKNWILSEDTYHPKNELVGGTLYCLGNGYMGLRGSYEELGTKGVQGHFVHAVFRKLNENRFFCHADTFCRKKYIFDEELMPYPEVSCYIQNLPDVLFLQVSIDDKVFRMWDGRLLDYRRTLNTKNGLLERMVRWDNGEGKITKFLFKRFCSMENPHVVFSKVEITPENYDGEVGLRSGIDASLEEAYEGNVVLKEGGRIALSTQIPSTHISVAQCVDHALSINGNRIEAEWRFGSELHRHAVTARVFVKKNQTLSIEKPAPVFTSQDQDAGNIIEQAQSLCSACLRDGFNTVFEQSVTAWESLWEKCDILIEGDDEAQQMLRYGLYHLIIASPMYTDKCSIGAKSLTGEGYSGYVFWDTEINIAPFYQWILPHVAENHYAYRHKMLPEAIENAKLYNGAGARYPWSSTIEGHEHNYRAIVCSRTQVHINLDVAYSMLRFKDTTGDLDFFERKSLEVVLQCVRYLAGVVEYNRKKDRYELLGVGGPDEYHPVTDNNAYTNYLVSYIFGRAISEFQALENRNAEQAAGLARKIYLDADELSHWSDIAEKIFTPKDAATQVIPQCDGFFDLKDQWERSGNDWGGPGAEYHLCKGLKQPDVILLLALLPEQFTREELVANWDYYERFILHGSSLSPSIHALIAAKIGLTQKAREYFFLSAKFDRIDQNNDTYAGIHIGNFGGLWQALAFGFAGLEHSATGLRFDPHLPLEWKSLSFNLLYQGIRLHVKISNLRVDIFCDSDVPDGMEFSCFGQTEPAVKGGIRFDRKRC